MKARPPHTITVIQTRDEGKMPHKLVLQNQGHGIGLGYYYQGHPNQYYQNQGHGIGHGHYNQGPQNYVDLNERVKGHIKVEALLLMVVLTHGFSPSGCVTWTTSLRGTIC